MLFCISGLLCVALVRSDVVATDDPSDDATDSTAMNQMDWCDYYCWSMSVNYTWDVTMTMSMDATTMATGDEATTNDGMGDETTMMSWDWSSCECNGKCILCFFLGSYYVFKM